MASYSRENINALVNDRIEKRIGSSSVRLHPLFNLLAAQDPSTSPYAILGQPGMRGVFGSMNMDPIERENGIGSFNRHFRITKFESEAASGVSHGGATPVATTRADENIGTFETRYTHVMKPVEMNKHTLERMADAGNAVGMANYVVSLTAEPHERFVKSIHQRWWTDSPTESEQNAKTWTKFLGLQHTLTEDNVYGRVDRTVATGLDPNVLDASADFNSPSIALEMIRKINSGFTRVTAQTTFDGLKHRSGDGSGATCWITTPTLWQELADQIESRYVIQQSDMPKHGLGGFKYDTIYYNNTYIISDYLCPAGEMYGINPNTWLLETDSRHNMRFMGPYSEAETVRGGDYIEWGQFTFQGRLTCREAFCNARVTNLTA